MVMQMRSAGPDSGALGHDDRPPLPTTLSPSKVSSFTSCALAFRFSSIDRLPEEPSVAASKGTLVHRALELLFRFEPAERTLDRAVDLLDTAWQELADHPEFAGLGLDADGEARMRADAVDHVHRYFEIEDPTTVHAVGLEVMVAADVEGLHLRGIIDRLDWVGPGQFVVTDYKTGRAPGQGYERAAMLGVRFYALLVERVLGVRPVEIRLVYLGGSTPQVVSASPSEANVRGVARKATAVWQTIERAHATDAFKPRRSALCDWCSFQAYCPEFGGDPAEGRRLAIELRSERQAARDDAAGAGAGSTLRAAGQG